MNDDRPRAPRAWVGWAWRAAALLACVGVFLQYLRPDLTVDLANRLWSCF